MEGNIYKITGGGKTYYGSTTQDIEKRFREHKNEFKRFKKGARISVSSFEILDFEDVKIELVERFKYNTKNELLIRETFYIQNNECVNRLIPINVETHEKRHTYYKRYYDKKKYGIDKKHFTLNMDELIKKNNEHFRKKEENRLSYKQI